MGTWTGHESREHIAGYDASYNAWTTRRGVLMVKLADSAEGRALALYLARRVAR